MNKFPQDIFFSNGWIGYVIFGFSLAFLPIFSENIISKLIIFFKIKSNKFFFNIKFLSCILTIAIMFFCNYTFLYFKQGKNIFLEIYNYALSDYHSIFILLSFVIIILIPILILISFILYGLYLKLPEIKNCVMYYIYKLCKCKKQ